MQLNHQWLHMEEIQPFLENGNEYFHLKKPVSFKITQEVISVLMREYNSQYEKGGLLIGKPIENENLILIDKVVFIKNIHPEPEHFFRFEQTSYKTVCQNALEDGNLPFIFHTHPTKEENLILEQQNFLQQINTSLQDRKVSYLPISIGEEKLLLPDVLIVGNGTTANTLFIGFYNGKIAPCDFTKHKEEVGFENMESLVEKGKNFYQKDINKIILAVLAILLIFMLIKAPKAFVGLTIALVSTAPLLLFLNQDNNQYFCLTHGESVDIEIPD